MVSESDTLSKRGTFSDNFSKSTVFSTLNRCKTPLIGLQTSFFVNQHVLQQSKVLCSLVWHPKNSVLGVLKWRRQEFCDFMITLGTRILTSSNSELSEGICMIPNFFLSKKSSLILPYYFYGVLAATNLWKISLCSSSITKIALWWILTYRTIIPVITAHISPGNQSVDQFWSSGTLGSHFYNLKYSNHHRIDRDIWKISREIW